MREYDHLKIEKKWQKEWEKNETYKTLNHGASFAKATASQRKKKMYVLDMFPYPSGVGLHVGHPRGYIGSDVYARMKRMEGYNVLHPMGYDAFGLPAEQYALQHKIHPKKAVEENVATFEKQLSMIGLSYDWSRKINTTDPKYYKWTQWIFLQIYNSWYDKTKNKARGIKDLEAIFVKSGNEKVDAVCNIDTAFFTAKDWKTFSKKEKEDIFMKYRLAYEGHSEVNWCPEMGTVLANDEIVNNENGNPVSERGGYPVEKKSMRQWFMRITAYADRLLSGLDGLEWSDHIKEIQKNWIGKSEGSDIEFKIKNHNEKIKVFTTRADTIFGVTYVVLAPEHSLVQKLKSNIKNWNEVEKYISNLKNKSEEDRTKTEKEKTGIELKGIFAINPANGEEIPVWIADYVLASYGTGAVMAVPAHDVRDFAFANKYNLEIKTVIEPFIIKNDGTDAIKEGIDFSERQVVVSIIKHWSENKYLMSFYKKNGWKGFVCGGIENSESIGVAGVREIFEETGYKNAKFVKHLGTIHSKFYHEVKAVNRFAHFEVAYFELKDGYREETSEEEQALHDVVWLSPDEVSKAVNREDIKIAWNFFINGNCFVDDGVLTNSGKFNEKYSEEARGEITKFVGGKIVTKYKMRDAIFARQRYWGEPIPLKHNIDGTITVLKEKELPLELPNVKSYESIGTGESPLAGVKSWVKEGYETNTMPGWAGSSWYFLRYMDPQNSKNFVSKKAVDYWKDVDMYVGGLEHATGHLLYSRFWNNFLYDMGYVPNREPFKKLKNQGMILGSDSRKMSKRWGNVINPDEIVKNYGADTLRVYEMFMGPFDQSLPWSTESIIGSRRFVERVFRLQAKVNKEKSSEDVEKILHKTIKKVSEDIENFDFNTAISAMMIFINEMDKAESISLKDFKMFLQILAPFAPHIAEELWSDLTSDSDSGRSKKGKSLQNKSIHLSSWPKWDKKKIIDDQIKIAVQVNGKVRTEIRVSKDIKEEEIRNIALKNKNIIVWIEKKEIKRFIYIPGRIINIVV